MEMIIRVEERETEAEFARCHPYKTVPCRSGKLNLTICNQVECYICNFLQKALVNFEIEEHKGDTINAIGRLTQHPFWIEANTKEKIEYIAYFLATRPSERQILGRFGAVRLTRTEALNIVKMKKMPFNFFAVLEVSQTTYVDDVAHGTALRLFLECGNDRYAMYFDQIRGHLDEKRGAKEMLLDSITDITNTAIVESILGLGYVFKHKGFMELKDMPDIINGMESELRNFNTENFKHKIRGQHPDRWNTLENA
eukprot:16440912-Heterocapsa_arctica.AAC.1